MRSWWKTLRILGVVAAGLALVQTAAYAQFPPPMSGFGMPPGPAMGMPTSGGGMAPGAFTNSNPGAMRTPADFPNPACGPQEPMSPFTLKDDGWGNAFSGE